LLAAKSESKGMAQIALQLKSGSAFGKIIMMIDQMISDLRAEGQEDIAHRDRCENSQRKNGNEKEDLEHAKQTLKGEIERLENTQKDASDMTDASVSDKEDMEKELAERLKIRNEEHEEFLRALKADTDAVKTIVLARKALTDFYKKNGDGKNLLQTAGDAEALLWHSAEVWGKDGGDTAGSKTSKGAPQGVITALDIIKEDLENEIKTSKAAEASAQKEFEEQKAAALKSLEALNAKKVTLEQLEADLDEKIAETGEEKLGKKTMKAQKKQYREDLKPKCDWMKEAFDTRRVARQDEMTGLMHAKASLAGGEEGGEEEEVLVQKGSFLDKRRA